MKTNATLTVTITTAMFLLGGCESTVLKTQNTSDFDPYIDGGALSYFLPSGVLPVTLEYKDTTGLSMTQGTFEIVPDIWQRYNIVYSRSGLSSDEVSIEKGANGLLKSVSSTTEDQTVALVQEVKSVVSEVATLKKTLDQQKTLNAAQPKAFIPPPGCDMPELQTVVRINLTHRNTSHNRIKGSNTCFIQFGVEFQRTDESEVQSFQKGDATSVLPNCYEVVCFRTLGGFIVNVTATLVDTSTAGRPKNLTSIRFQGEFVAPVPEVLGFVRFARRPFVKNKTTATFTDGILTKLSSTDPSSVVGFFALPIEILKTATILVQI